MNPTQAGQLDSTESEMRKFSAYNLNFEPII